MRLMFISGSSHVGSVNWKLASVAADIAKDAFSYVETIALDPARLDLPRCDQHAHQETPDEIIELQALIGSANGFFVSSDEYTGVYSSLLKNMVDWLRLADADQQTPFWGAPVALCGIAGRGAGGLRGQPALQQFFRELGATVISQQLELGSLDGPLDESGRLFPKVRKQMLDGCLSALCSRRT